MPIISRNSPLALLSSCRWVRAAVACLAALTVLTAACAARAQTPAEAARLVAPFVNDSTILVLRCDASALNFDAMIDEFALKSGTAQASATPEEKQRHAAEITKFKTDAKAWQSAFVAAGGKHIFASLGFRLDDPPVVIIVPTTPASKPDGLIAAIKDGLPAEFTKECKVVDGAVLASNSKESLDALAAPSPARTEDLERAFAACTPGASLHAVFVPSAVVRKAFSELMPNLPEELGGAPITAVTQGATWGALSCTFAPAGSLSLRLQSVSPAAAVAFVDAFKVIADKAALDATARALPGGEAFVRLLTPAAQGDQVVLSLAGNDFDSVKSVLVPALVRARQSAREIMAATQVRGLVQGCIIFAEGNKGEYPPSLEALLKPGIITEELLINPSYPSRKPGFAYVRPDPKNEFASDVVMVYETHDAWPKTGIWVGYCDGHVERVVSQDAFKKSLSNKGNAK